MAVVSLCPQPWCDCFHGHSVIISMGQRSVPMGLRCVPMAYRDVLWHWGHCAVATPHWDKAALVPCSDLFMAGSRQQSLQELWPCSCLPAQRSCWSCCSPSSACPTLLFSKMPRDVSIGDVTARHGWKHSLLSFEIHNNSWLWSFCFSLLSTLTSAVRSPGLCIFCWTNKLANLAMKEDRGLPGPLVKATWKPAAVTGWNFKKWFICEWISWHLQAMATADTQIHR